MGTKTYLIAALIACWVPASVSAYYLETRGTTTDPVRYVAADVDYRINTSTFPAGVTGIEEAIHAAFQTWTDADCADITFVDDGVSDYAMPDPWTNGLYVLVYFDDTAGEWASGPAVGHFYFGFNPTGEMIGASVILNSRDHAWATDGATGALDVQGTVTALIGRSLGITSTMEGNATYPVYAPGDTTKRTLGADDLAAIEFLYVDSACVTPTDPEMICPQTDPPGSDPCPPEVVTMPPDGGTLPREDAGTTTQPDAGTTVDGGPGGPDDGGCGCRTVGVSSTHGGASVLAIMLGLAFFSRRRRS